MVIEEAEEILRHATHEANGTYTILRLGEHPGEDAVNNLKSALRLIGRQFSGDCLIPRKVALSCGIIMHFASECMRNMAASGASLSAISAVRTLEQEAFNTLAGDDT